MKGITPNLWFDHQAEDAAKFYVSIFPNSRIKHIARYGDAGASVSGRPKGSVMTVSFELDGQEFVGLNGGPHFQFSEAVSFIIHCETQEEIDDYWQKLIEGGGSESMCGWLKDRFGLSWQVVPTMLDEMFQDADPAKAERVMSALLPMKKLDIATLKRAAEG